MHFYFIVCFKAINDHAEAQGCDPATLESPTAVQSPPSPSRLLSKVHSNRSSFPAGGEGDPTDKVCTRISSSRASQAELSCTCLELAVVLMGTAGQLCGCERSKDSKLQPAPGAKRLETTSSWPLLWQGADELLRGPEGCTLPPFTALLPTGAAHFAQSPSSSLSNMTFLLARYWE